MKTIELWKNDAEAFDGNLAMFWAGRMSIAAGIVVRASAMKKIIVALVALLMAGPAMAADGWLYALEGAMAEVVQANQTRRERDEAEMAETRERIERAAAEQRAEMRAQQIRAAAEQANFETFMLRQELRRGK